ncbi:MAG: hypothetical protein ABW220_14650 [Burkholderiaceae bacterium]
MTRQIATDYWSALWHFALGRVSELFHSLWEFAASTPAAVLHQSVDADPTPSAQSSPSSPHQGEALPSNGSAVPSSSETLGKPPSQTFELGTFETGTTLSFTRLSGQPVIQVNPDGTLSGGSLADIRPDTSVFDKFRTTIGTASGEYLLDEIRDGMHGWIYEMQAPGPDVSSKPATYLMFLEQPGPHALPLPPQPVL